MRRTRTGIGKAVGATFLTSLVALSSGGGAQSLVIDAPRSFDGERIRSEWRLVVAGSRIVAFGPKGETAIPAGADHLTYDDATLLPGLIEGHSHLLLHPYDETPWNVQVLNESRALRVARGTVHAAATLRAGFTTTRDLGSEGAGYADVGLKQAIDRGVILGPRMLVAGRAIVATGSYGPKGFDPDFEVPLGAEPADGDNLIRVVRDQIGKGADIVKVYADYRWGPRGEARPTFTLKELEAVVAVASSSGRPVVAHAATAEGMRRATLAGVATIEHGDGGTPEVFALMVERNVALCPTLAAGEAISRYDGWNGEEPAPDRIEKKREMMRQAIAAGVTLCNGSDSGVFDHGDNAWEIELMVDYGLSAIDALRAATSVNAQVLGLNDRGRLEVGRLADLVVVSGDPTKEIGALRRVISVVLGGKIVTVD